MQNVNTLCIAAQSPQDTHSTYGIVQRTESDRMANAIRLDGGRNPIGWRTQSDRTADGNLWQRGHFQGALLGGALVSSAPTKQTGREFPQNTRNTQNLLAEKASHR